VFNDFSYKDLKNHGDTAFDPYTGRVCFLIHISYSKMMNDVMGRWVGAMGCDGFLGYARKGKIYLISNRTMKDFVELMHFSPSAVLIEKTKPLYASKKVYERFAECNGTQVGYEAHLTKGDI